MLLVNIMDELTAHARINHAVGHRNRVIPVAIVAAASSFVSGCAYGLRQSGSYKEMELPKKMSMAVHMHMHLLQEVQRPSKLPVAVVALVGASIRLAANKDLAQSTLELRGCGLIQQALVVLGNDGETAAVDRPGASHDKTKK